MKVVSYTQENINSEWTDGKASKDTVVFDNGIVFVDISDGCPGASRSTQRASKDGETLGFYTYCEDAGNQYGDRNLLRACENAFWNYLDESRKQKEITRQRKLATHKASIDTFIDREMPFLAA